MPAPNSRVVTGKLFPDIAGDIVIILKYALALLMARKAVERDCDRETDSLDGFRPSRLKS